MTRHARHPFPDISSDDINANCIQIVYWRIWLLKVFDNLEIALGTKVRYTAEEPK